MTDFRKVGEFAVPFAKAMAALRNARDANEGVSFDPDEVRALMDAIQMLSHGNGSGP